jgi:hypothetical protein
LIKVIGAGFGRTGTMSLKLALERLGFGPCYHFTEVMRSRHASAWLRITNGAAPDWDRLLAGYSATTDWPAAAYYRELASHYPEARVILTLRDPDDWYMSICHTLVPLRQALKLWIPGMRVIARLTDKLIWHGTFDGRIEDTGHALAAFNAHREAVRRNIAPDRLLEFDVRDGWPPLCEFLGVPVPEGVPFPRTNDSASVRRQIFALRALTIVLPATLLVTMAWLFLVFR